MADIGLLITLLGAKGTARDEPRRASCRSRLLVPRSRGWLRGGVAASLVMAGRHREGSGRGLAATDAEAHTGRGGPYSPWGYPCQRPVAEAHRAARRGRLAARYSVCEGRLVRRAVPAVDALPSSRAQPVIAADAVARAVHPAR